MFYAEKSAEITRKVTFWPHVDFALKTKVNGVEFGEIP